MKNKKVLVFFTSLLIFSLFPLFSQEQLGQFNTSWSNVISGKVITDPVVTSYGFCVVTDGRTLSAFSNEGVLLWEKPTKSSKYVKISCLNEDFIALWDKRKNSLKLFNPSGYLIWDKTLSYDLTTMPYPGRDGRFFITGKEIIECYSINGICKWSVETPPQKGKGLKELPDGTLIVFLEENEGKTNALRISPFGKVIETIEFAGEVVKAYTLPNGIFLTFSDNTSGLFSIVNGLSQNKWVIGAKPTNSYLIADTKHYLFLELYENKITVDKINPQSGEITGQFDINNINGNDLQLAKLNDSGLFIADSTNCYIINLDGSVNYNAKMLEDKERTRWNYVIYTRDNHLVFCLENWSINAYLTSQVRYSNKFRPISSYDEYYTLDLTPYSFSFIDRIDRDLISEERFANLQKGYYGEKEIVYASDIYSFCQAYLHSSGIKSTTQNLTVFDKDGYGVERAFQQLPLLCSYQSSDCIARLISITSNKSYLYTLINCVTTCGYDPEGKMLKELELVFPKLNYKDLRIQKSLCDAVYSICLFMGRPAYNRRGKDIIQQMLLPQYDQIVRDYAKETMVRIAALDK